MADGYASRIDNLAYASAAERLLDAVAFMPGASGILPRPGVKPGAAVTLSVLTGPDRVTVPAHGGVLLSTPPASSTLSYVYALPAAVTKSFAARPSSGTSRIDLIVVRVYDAGADSSTALKELDVEIIAGTAAASPSAPTQPNGTLLLGTATVPNAASIVITTPPPRTVTSGGIVPVANSTDLGTLVPYNGMVAFQEDTGVYQARVGGAWAPMVAGYAPHFRAQLSGAVSPGVMQFTSVADSEAGWNAGTWTYTVKKPGVYRVAGGMKQSGTAAMFFNFTKNGSNWYVSQSVSQALAGHGVFGARENAFAANDTITMTAGAAYTADSVLSNFFEIDWVRP